LTAVESKPPKESQEETANSWIAHYEPHWGTQARSKAGTRRSQRMLGSTPGATLAERSAIRPKQLKQSKPATVRARVDWLNGLGRKQPRQPSGRGLSRYSDNQVGINESAGEDAIRLIRQPTAPFYE
jgi:hypothetical protein